MYPIERVLQDIVLHSDSFLRPLIIAPHNLDYYWINGGSKSSLVGISSDGVEEVQCFDMPSQS